MSEYRFKPAPMRPAELWEVCEDALVQYGKPHVVLPFDEITELQLFQVGMRGNQVIQLEIHGSWGMTVISLNAATNRPERDSNVAIFHALIAALTEKLELARPELRITHDDRRNVKWALFTIGAASIGLALTLLALAVATGVPGDRLMAGAGPFGTMLFLGVLICLNIHPWKTTPVMTMAEARQAMTRKSSIPLLGDVSWPTLLRN